MPDYLETRFSTATTGEYPSAVKALVLMALKKVALGWIDDNTPQAWYRPMFEDNN